MNAAKSRLLYLVGKKIVVSIHLTSNLLPTPNFGFSIFRKIQIKFPEFIIYYEVSLLAMFGTGPLKLVRVWVFTLHRSRSNTYELPDISSSYIQGKCQLQLTRKTHRTFGTQICKYLTLPSQSTQLPQSKALCTSVLMD